MCNTWKKDTKQKTLNTEDLMFLMFLYCGLVRGQYLYSKAKLIAITSKQRQLNFLFYGPDQP